MCALPSPAQRYEESLPGSSGAVSCKGAAAPLLTWELRYHDRLIRATVDGELDLATAPSLGEQFSPIAETGHHLILNVARLSFCAVAGLNLFVALHHQAETAGGSLQLATPSAALQRVLRLTRLNRVLTTAPDVTSAITTLRRQAIATPTVAAS